MTNAISVTTRFHEPSFREAVFEYSRTDDQPPTLPQRLKRAVFVLGGGALFGTTVLFLMLVVTNAVGEQLGASHMFAAALGIFGTVAAWSRHASKMSAKAMEMAAETATIMDPTTFVFDSDGFRQTSLYSTTRTEWPAITGVKLREHATIIQMGPAAYAVPHHDLPDGMTPDDFGAQINSWRTA
jgi:hypothetical protein